MYEVTLRSASSFDLEAILHIYNQGIEDVVSMNNSPWIDLRLINPRAIFTISLLENPYQCFFLNWLDINN